MFLRLKKALDSFLGLAPGYSHLSNVLLLLTEIQFLWHFALSWALTILVRFSRDFNSSETFYWPDNNTLWSHIRSILELPDVFASPLFTSSAGMKQKSHRRKTLQGRNWRKHQDQNSKQRSQERSQRKEKMRATLEECLTVTSEVQPALGKDGVWTLEGLGADRYIGVDAILRKIFRSHNTSYYVSTSSDECYDRIVRNESDFTNAFFPIQSVSPVLRNMLPIFTEKAEFITVYNVTNGE